MLRISRLGVGRPQGRPFGPRGRGTLPTNRDKGFCLPPTLNSHRQRPFSCSSVSSNEQNRRYPDATAGGGQGAVPWGILARGEDSAKRLHSPVVVPNPSLSSSFSLLSSFSWPSPFSSLSPLSLVSPTLKPLHKYGQKPTPAFGQLFNEFYLTI